MLEKILDNKKIIGTVATVLLLVIVLVVAITSGDDNQSVAEVQAQSIADAQTEESVETDTSDVAEAQAQDADSHPTQDAAANHPTQDEAANHPTQDATASQLTQDTVGSQLAYTESNQANLEGREPKASFNDMSVQGFEAYFTEASTAELNSNAQNIDAMKLRVALYEGCGPRAQMLAAAQMEEEYGNFAIADVDKYVNVRSEASTEGEIVGRMYDGAVAQIQEEVECEDGIWLNVTSGSLNGYIKAEYFIYGHDAVAVIDDYIDRYAVVKADRLNIRENPDLESKRIGYALTDEKLKLADKETDAEWIHVNYSDGKTGYVSGEYVTVVEEFIYAKTIEEIKAEEEAEKARKAREKEDEKKTPENVQMAEAPSAPASTATYTASGNVRSDIVNFALQYLGHPYVHGGNSLENGTDCSGFTSLVYAQFGVGLSRTPGGQLSSNGRSVSLDQIQPGDIVCYGKSRCTHVAIYIGDGQIVHAANPRKGIVTQRVGYDNILGVKNVLD